MKVINTLGIKGFGVQLRTSMVFVHRCRLYAFVVGDWLLFLVQFTSTQPAAQDPHSYSNLQQVGGRSFTKTSMFSVAFVGHSSNNLNQLAIKAGSWIRRFVFTTPCRVALCLCVRLCRFVEKHALLIFGFAAGVSAENSLRRQTFNCL